MRFGFTLTDEARRKLIALLLVCLLRKTPPDKRAIGRNLKFLIPCGVAMGFNWILLFEAYKYTTVSVATLSYYFAPIIVEYGRSKE